MACSFDDFWSQVFWGSAETVGEFIRSHSLFGETEVSDSDMTVFVQQHVFWLEITIDYTVLMQATNGVYYLCGVNLSPLLSKPLVFSQVGEHLSSVQEVNDEV